MFTMNVNIKYYESFHRQWWLIVILTAALFRFLPVAISLVLLRTNWFKIVMGCSVIAANFTGTCKIFNKPALRLWASAITMNHSAFQPASFGLRKVCLLFICLFFGNSGCSSSFVFSDDAASFQSTQRSTWYAKYLQYPTALFSFHQSEMSNQCVRS